MRTQTPAYHIYLALPTLLWPSRPTGLPSAPVSMPTESDCVMPSLIPLTLSKSSIPGSDASLNTAPSLGGAGGGRRLPLMGCLPFCLYQICDTTLEYTRAFTPFTRQLTLRRCEALTPQASVQCRCTCRGMRGGYRRRRATRASARELATVSAFPANLRNRSISISSIR